MGLTLYMMILDIYSTLPMSNHFPSSMASRYLQKSSSAQPKYTAHQLATLLDVSVLSHHFAETFASTEFATHPLSLTQSDELAQDGLVVANQKCIEELAAQVVRPGASPKKSINVEYVAVQWPDNMKGLDHRVGLYASLPAGKYPNLFIGFKKAPGPNGNSSGEILLPLRQMEYLILHWASLIPVIDQLKTQLSEIGKVAQVEAEAATSLKRKAFTLAAPVAAPAPVPSLIVNATHSAPTQVFSRPTQPQPANFAELQRMRAAQAAYDLAMAQAELEIVVPESPLNE